jgi:hypothetical protein
MFSKLLILIGELKQFFLNYDFIVLDFKLIPLIYLIMKWHVEVSQKEKAQF